MIVQIGCRCVCACVSVCASKIAPQHPTNPINPEAIWTNPVATGPIINEIHLYLTASNIRFNSLSLLVNSPICAQLIRRNGAGLFFTNKTATTSIHPHNKHASRTTSPSSDYLTTTTTVHRHHLSTDHHHPRHHPVRIHSCRDGGGGDVGGGDLVVRVMVAEMMEQFFFED